MPEQPSKLDDDTLLRLQQIIIQMQKEMGEMIIEAVKHTNSRHQEINSRHQELDRAIAILIEVGLSRMLKRLTDVEERLNKAGL